MITERFRIQKRRAWGPACPAERGGSDFFEDVNPAGAAQTDHVGHADLGTFHLAPAGFASEMSRYLVDVGDTGGTQWVALGEQAA